MSRTTITAILVFVAVLLVGTVDMITFYRTEQVRADYAKQMSSMEAYVAAQFASLSKRVDANERVINIATERSLNAMQLTVDMHADLKHHKKHAVPQPEREQPSPIFR